MKFTAESAIAFGAAFIALLSLGVSFWQLEVQRRFNRNTLRPLPWFFIRNGDDEFFVNLYNHGTGPMIIVSTTFEINGQSRRHLHNALPKFEGDWEYAVLSPGKIIGADKEIRIWHYTFHEATEEAALQAQTLKESLCSVKATVIYKDVYDQQYPPFVRDFAFLKNMGEEPENEAPSHS